MTTNTVQAQPDREIVAGIDTHENSHHVAVLDSTGRLLGDEAFPATSTGFIELLSWVSVLGTLVRVAVEGTSSYGAALTRYLLAENVDVIEVPPGDKAQRRRRGKTDAFDAEAAARRALAETSPRIPKDTTSSVEALRLLSNTRNLLVKQQKEIAGQIDQFLITAPDTLRELSREGTRKTRMRRLAELPETATADIVTDTLTRLLRQHATRWLTLDADATAIEKQLRTLIEIRAPKLLEVYCVAAVTAAQLLVAVGENGHRIHSEAALAKLFGAAPQPVSSGKTNRHRLSRGGNRQANCALHQISIARLCHEQRTRDYRDTHLADGKTKKDILRLLKRALCRELFPLLCRP
ncbi:IS110 family transposase [Rathayibacter sp. PhB185]|uniref:IS110 family transposase n=1 Tax=Rathayibacter sp. PhB185 TaxID=2485198 RepID=UPI000F4BE901|nr:IS110 family transposase [Rathayibacter sp. PhB185]ROS46556.1 transposase [Rathayibacter sp. PhB185]